MLKWLVPVKPRVPSESYGEPTQESTTSAPSTSLSFRSAEDSSREEDFHSEQNYVHSKKMLTTKAKAFIRPGVETLVTDDPLAALEKSISQSVTGSAWSKSKLSSPFKKKQEEIYSVTRVNPLFYEIDEEFQQQTEDCLPMSVSSSSRFESRWSSADPDCAKLQPPTHNVPLMPGSPGKTASSSGYESLSREPHFIVSSHNKTRQPAPSRSPNSINKSASSTSALAFSPKFAHRGTGKRTIGSRRAQIVLQNPDYLVKIQMASGVAPTEPTTSVSTSSNYQLMSLPSYQPVPRPIWPDVPDTGQYHIPRVTTTAPGIATPSNLSLSLKKLEGHLLVEQNERYVTDIRIVPPPNMLPTQSDSLRQTSDESSSMSPTARGPLYPFPPLPAHYYSATEEGIPPDSLLTNFPTFVDDDRSSNPADILDYGEAVPFESYVLPRSDAVLRDFSQKLSQNPNLNKVSRAFSTSGTSSSLYGYLHRVDPPIEDQVRAKDSINFAKKMSAFKELWEKSGMKTNGRRLLIESDDDDEKQVAASKRRVEVGPGLGLSSPSFRFGLVDERQTLANPFSFNPLHLPRSGGVLPSASRTWDADRLSNSSRSSSSRRVTFSADTVDNEQSNPSLAPSSPTKATVSTETESAAPSKSEELQLTPKFLPSVYSDYYEAEPYPSCHQKAYKTHYTNNIVLYGSANKAISVGNGLGIPKTGIDVLPRYSLSRSLSNQLPPTENPQKGWESYYGMAQHPVLPGNANTNASTLAKTYLESNMVLHPNYGAACPDLDMCMDFTIDTQRPKSVSHKLVRRLCCSLVVLLGVGVFIVVVVGLSMYLTEGQRVFGPI